MGVEIEIGLPGAANADALAVPVTDPPDGFPDDVRARLQPIAESGELRGKRANGGEPRPIERISIAHAGSDELRAAAERAALLAERTNRARDLANMPPNELNPQTLAEQASKLADEHEHLSAEALGPKEM